MDIFMCKVGIVTEGVPMTARLLFILQLSD